MWIEEYAVSQLSFFVRTDVAVIGHNSEMADMSNPRGEIYGDVDYIVAEAPDGTRFAHHTYAVTSSGGVTESEVSSARLEALAHHLNTKRPALNGELWREIEPRYGSEVYVSGGWEEAQRLYERQQDEENRF